MLPKDFRDQLKEHLLDLHWKQWRSFGVSTHLERAEGFILDLEALAVSTLTVGLLDKRLFEASLEWGRNNRQWLNLNRVKRIGKFFTLGYGEGNEGPLGSSALESCLRFIKKQHLQPEDERSHTNAVQNEHAAVITNFQARGIVVEPDVNLPCLHQIHQRSLFGVDARAEMFLYFLTGRKGNSNFISKEIFLEQKNLYRIINHWVDSGILEKAPESGGTGFALRDKDAWMKTLRIKELPQYVNWPRIFKFVDSVFLYLDEHSIEDDTYLASSFFRDIHPDAQYAASVTKTDLPPPKSYPGKEYYGPFADAVLQIAEKITM